MQESVSPGKTSSLRSIRVKPERQKDKAASESTKMSNPESTTLDQSTLTAPVIKSEPEDFQPSKISEEQPPQIETITKPLDIKVEVKVETSVTVEVKLDERKDEAIVKKEVEKKLKEEPDIIKPSIPEGTKTEGSIIPEPMTNAVAPVVTTAVPEKNMSPIEGKENIPSTKSDPVGETPKESASVMSPLARAETNSIRREDDTTLRDVKRIKLDILKEGGLEVTPVRSTSMATSIKEFRPSVIQAPSNAFVPKSPMGPPPLLSNVLPKRRATSLPANINITQIKASTTPVKQTKPPESFQFLNGATPPKVVQSRSIYSYSEKVVYGNPKDIFQPSMMPHTPKTIPMTVPRQPSSGGDPMDLSLTSPQKPALEIMPTAHSFAQTPYNRASVTKNLYKTTPPPLPDGRKLGPNLEITLVNSSRHPNVSYVPKHSLPKRSGSETYAQKIAKLKSEELKLNSKYSSSIPTMYKSPADIPVPSNVYVKNNSSSSSSSSNSSSNNMNAPKPDFTKHKPPMAPPAMPHQPYLPPRFAPPETPNPFSPLMENLYYHAALQNMSLYSSLSTMPPPMLPLPTPEQLKFYAELMAHGRLMPFSQPPDGHPSMKKP